LKSSTGLKTNPVPTSNLEANAPAERDTAPDVNMPHARRGGEDLAHYEPIGRSALRHPFLVGSITCLGLLVGLAIGYEHHPAYSAEAQLMVGRTSSLAEDQIPGLAAGVQGLASNYARLITSGDVVSETEHYLHRSSLPGSLTASPVALSSVIDVIASAPSEAESLDLANAGALALTNVVTAATNDSQAQLQPLLSAYTKAEHTYQAATAEANMLQHQLDVLFAKLGDNAPSPSQAKAESSINSRIVAEQTIASEAQLKANAYNNQYNAALPPLTAQEEMVQQTGPANFTGSDRKSFMEAAGLLGLVGGLVVGFAAASRRDVRRLRRKTSPIAS